MSFLKNIEKYNKWIILNFLKLFLRNKEIHYPLDKNKIKKILILRYDVLGDMIITIPMIDYLKSLLPNAEIDILCSSKNFEIGKNIVGVRNSYKYSGKKFFFNELNFLKKENYDLIISLVFNKTSLSGLMANYINKKAIKVTLMEIKRAELYSILFNILLPLEYLKGQITLLELQLRMITMLFGEPFDTNKANKASLKIDKSYLKQSIEFFKTSSNKKIIYNISAGSDYRTFSTNKNIEILMELMKIYHEYEFYLSFYKDDSEKAMMILGSLESKNIKILPQSSNIFQLIAYIKYSDLVITPDTSIVHIASMFNIPTVIFYSRLGPLANEWAPFNNKYIQIITEGRTSIEELEKNKIIEEISNFLKI